MSPLYGLVSWEHGWVWVDESVEPHDRWQVLVVELFHAGGVDGHPFGETRFAHTSPEAVALVGQDERVVTLLVGADLRADLVLAVAWWNAELGWGKFQIG